MIILDTVRDWILNFERKDLFRACLVYLAVCVIVVVGLLMRYVYVLQEMQGKIVQLNKARSAVQQILTQYQAVQQQKNKVEAELKQHANFNIQKYYQDLASKFGVSTQSTVKFSRQKLPNGYTEESVLVTINQTDTKTMCEILQAIEQQVIIYTQYVDISKASGAKKINVSFSIATLSAQE